LSARLESQDLTGSLKTNGNTVNKIAFRKETGYVMQSDALFPLLTVRETLRFAAYLRVHNVKSREEKNKIAEETLQLLRLEDCADTIIGDNDNRGISGGQKRRVSIGVDIVHHPSVIFLDEPTSGLDSSTALSVIDSLKQLCIQQNSTVIMTIHQPSVRLFNLLDKVIFLNTGRVTYYGPSSELITAINRVYADAKLGNPPIANPPEVFLDVTDQLKQEDRLELVTDIYKENTVAGQDISQRVNAVDTSLATVTSYANSVLGDILLLSERALLNVLRTKEHFIGRMFSAIFFGVQMGTLFLFTKHNQEGIQFQAAYFAFTMAFFYYTSLEALPIFLAEREIFQREFSRGAYRAFSYTISSAVVYFPFLFAIGLVYTSISWWLVGLPNQASAFFFEVFTVFIVLVTGHNFSTAVSVVAPNPMTGTIITCSF
jgi:ATP-binding cassette subfamily G (WHITE) protein 2